MKTLGERIADLRRERGITQENLAGIIGVSAQAISKWENNATMPDITLLPIIADTLGVTIDELFGIRRKVQEKLINCEETPKAVYDQILNTMWRSGDNNDLRKEQKRSLRRTHTSTADSFPKLPARYMQIRILLSHISRAIRNP